MGACSPTCAARASLGTSLGAQKASVRFSSPVCTLVAAGGRVRIRADAGGPAGVGSSSPSGLGTARSSPRAQSGGLCLSLHVVCRDKTPVQRLFCIQLASSIQHSQVVKIGSNLPWLRSGVSGPHLSDWSLGVQLLLWTLPRVSDLGLRKHRQGFEYFLLENTGIH